MFGGDPKPEPTAAAEIETAKLREVIAFEALDFEIFRINEVPESKKGEGGADVPLPLNSETQPLKKESNY